MPLPWFKLWSSIVAHPKTRALEEATSNPQALAYIIRLLCWFSEYAPSGAATARGRRGDGATTARAVERACEWNGAEGALYAALLDTGWLEEERGAVVLHGWAERQGAQLKKAEKDREAKKLKRLHDDAARRRRGDGAETARAANHPVATTARLEERRRDEKRGEEEATPPSPSQQSLLSIQPKPRPTAEDLQALWNRLADEYSLARWVGFGKTRRAAADAALEACPDLAQWEAWLRHQFTNPFMLGQNDRRWKADVDWLLRVQNRERVLDFDPERTPAPPARNEGDAEQAEISELFGEERP